MGCLEEAGVAVGAPGGTWNPAEATAATGENASPSREMGRETVIYSLILPFSFPPGLPTGLPTGLLGSEETRQPWKYRSLSLTGGTEKQKMHLKKSRPTSPTPCLTPSDRVRVSLLCTLTALSARELVQHSSSYILTLCLHICLSFHLLVPPALALGDCNF